MAKSNTARVLEDVSTKTEETAVVAAPATDDNGRLKVVTLSMEEVGTKGWKTKSDTIRGLWALNYSRSAIANFMGIRYQHVRNVLITPLKKTS